MSKKKQNEEKISIDQLARDAKKTALIGKFNLRFECKRIKGKWTTREECVRRYKDGQLPCASECAKVVLWVKEEGQAKALPKEEPTNKGETTMTEMKVCNRCKNEKPISQFRVSDVTGQPIATCVDCERKYKLGPYKNSQSYQSVQPDQAEQSSSLSNRVRLDFSLCPELLVRVRQRAKENFRTLSGQVCWELLQGEKRQE